MTDPWRLGYTDLLKESNEMKTFKGIQVKSKVLKENVRGSESDDPNDVQKVWNCDAEIHEHGVGKYVGSDKYNPNRDATKFSAYPNNPHDHDAFVGGVAAILKKHIAGNDAQFRSHGENHTEVIAQLPGGKQTYHVRVQSNPVNHHLVGRANMHRVSTWFSEKPADFSQF